MPNSMIIRELGKSERLYWLIDKLNCTNFSVTVETKNQLSSAKLQETLNSAVQAYPLLNVIITVDSKNRVVFEYPSQPPSVHIDCIQDNPHEYAETQIETHIAARACPMMRCGLFQRNGSSCVVFTFSHALTDAVPAVHLCKNIVLAASKGQALPSSPSPVLLPAQETIHPRKYRGFQALRLLPSYILDQISDIRRKGKPQQIPGLNNSRERTAGIESVHFENCMPLIRKCRQQKTTVQGAVCAAQLLAIFTEFSSLSAIPLSISSAVNLRDTLSQKISEFNLGMYIVLVPTLHCITGSTNIWELAREIKHELTRKTAAGYAHLFWQFFPPNIFFPPSIQGARRIQHLARSAPRNTVATNVGQIKRADNSDTAIQSISFAMATIPDDPLCSCVSTYGSHLIINGVFNLKLLSRDRARTIMHRMKKIIEDAAI